MKDRKGTNSGEEMASFQSPQDKRSFNIVASQLRIKFKQLKNDIISEFRRILTDDSGTEYSFWKTTKILVKISCKYFRSRTKMVVGSETTSKKLQHLGNTQKKMFQPNSVDDTESLLYVSGGDKNSICYSGRNPKSEKNQCK